MNYMNGPQGTSGYTMDQYGNYVLTPQQAEQWLDNYSMVQQNAQPPQGGLFNTAGNIAGQAAGAYTANQFLPAAGFSGAPEMSSIAGNFISQPASFADVAIGSTTEPAIATGWGTGMPATGSELMTGTGAASGAPQAAGGFMGLGPWGMAIPAAAVAAYFAPTAINTAQGFLDDTAQNDGNSALNAALLSNPITAWAAPILDGLGIGISSGKHEDQYARDAGRTALQDIGFLDSDHSYTLGDSTMNWGLDGNAMLEGGHLDGQRRMYDVDWGQEGIGDVVGAVDPLMAVFTQGNDKLTSDFAGYATNHIAMSGMDPTTATQQMYSDMGLDRNSAYDQVLQLYDKGKITGDQANAYRASIDKTFGVVNPNKGKGGEAEGFLPNR